MKPTPMQQRGEVLQECLNRKRMHRSDLRTLLELVIEMSKTLADVQAALDHQNEVLTVAESRIASLEKKANEPDPDMTPTVDAINVNTDRIAALGQPAPQSPPAVA